MNAFAALLLPRAGGSATSVAASLAIGTGANKVTLTAAEAGKAGNDISLTVAGVAAVSDGAKSLGYSEASNDMTVQLATSAAIAATLVIQGITITAKTKGLAGNALTIEFRPNVPTIDITVVENGTDILVKLHGTDTTTAQIKDALVAQSTLVTATGGDATWASPTGPTNLASGVNSLLGSADGGGQLLSTTAQLQGIFDTSTLVTAAGGSTGAAAVLAHTHLDGGV